MAKSRRHRRGGRTTPKGTRPHQRQDTDEGAAAGAGEPDLLAEVRQRLHDPLDLLAEASGLVSAVDPRSQDPWSADEPGLRTAVTLDQLVASFADVDRVETSALLAAIAQFAPDELTRARARRTAGRRRHNLPEWLTRLGEAQARRVVEMVHVLGDGDELIIELHVPGAYEMSVLVYVDHNLGTVVKDAFVLPVPLDEVVDLTQAQEEMPGDYEWRQLERAEARARLTQAIDDGALLYPPLESDSWPACRPLMEWVLRLLPEGGRGYERPVWDDSAKEALTAAFFASELGRMLDDEDHRELFEEGILWFATDYGPGDPLRWSPVAVEILLSDWLPRKVMADAQLLAKAPALLSAFVRYSHQQRGIRAGLTAETLEAVDRLAPEYQRTIRSPRPQGAAALLEAIGAFDALESLDAGAPWALPDEEGFGGFERFESFDLNTYMQEVLRRAVGGEQALQALDDRPLPDEAFGWEQVPDDIKERVGEVLEHCDRCCDELLGVEYRTACRRFLARAAMGDPVVFRRKARADIAAAAVCWTIGKANDLFTHASGGMLVKDLAAYFGLAQGGISQRASTLMKAAGIEQTGLGYYPAWDVALGDPALLTSSRRRWIIEVRDRYRQDA